MPGRSRKTGEYVFRSLRIHPRLWEDLEIVAGREQVSMNSLVNAMLQLALDSDVDDGSREAIHAMCTQWRARWEFKETARRREQGTATLPPQT